MSSLILADSFSYPLLNVFWTLLEFFLWVLWFFLIFRIIGDIFRSHDLSGGGKALWSLLVIVMPFLGVLIYIIVRGGSMHEREVQAAKQNDAAVRSYIQQAAGSGPSDELAKLAALRDQGILTNEEFAAQKAKLLG